MSITDNQSSDCAVGYHARCSPVNGEDGCSQEPTHIVVSLPTVKDGGGEDKSSGKTRLSRQGKIAIFAMALSNFSSFLAFATIAPFFPNEASKKGASDTEIGFIFGVFQLVIFITSPFYGSLVSKIGPRFLYLSGLFICSVCIILFGFLDLSPSGTTFVVLCLLCRIVDANGTAMLTTSSFTIMASTFPDHLSMVMGTLETCVALGAMAGPPLGGAMYEVGGYRLPFLVVGGVLFVAFIVSYFSIPHIESVSNGKKFYTLLRLPDAVLAFFQVFTANYEISLMDPIFSKRIQSINPDIGEAAIGGIFLVGPAAYAILAPAVGYLCDKIRGRLKFLIICGWVLATVSLLLEGPCPLLTFLKPSIWLLVLSYTLIGVGLVGCWLPSYQVCLNATIAAGNEDNIETYGMVAGLLGSGAALGAAVGPFVGGNLTEKIGFEWTLTFSAGVAFLAGISVAVSFVAEHLKSTHVPSIVSKAAEPDERAPLLQQRT